jgi:hypothetical protein
MARRLCALGTVLVALAGLWAALVAGGQLVLLALTTGLAVGAGAEVHARLHPGFGPVGGRRFDGFWIGPGLATVAAALVAGRLEGNLARAAPFVGAALVAVLLFAQGRELDVRPGERWTALSFALVLYLVAFALFVAIYGGRTSTYTAALAAGLCALLLAAALFRPTGASRPRIWLFAALLGLCTGELTLALGTWVVAGLLGGAFLLLYFYIAAGLLQALLDGSLDARLAIEYGVVGLVGLALILSTSPWRP